MPAQACVFIATSLDGYIARADGGLTIQRFLADGLIAEMTITRIPVLLGGGRPLFGPAERDITLEHLDTRSWEFGFVQSRYRVASHG